MTALVELGYDKPEPSLCGNCKFGYYMEGGSIIIGLWGKGSKEYKQRYCPYPPPGREGKPEGRAISMSGYQECEYYFERC